MSNQPQQEERKTPSQTGSVDPAKRQRDINWAAALATVIGLPLALAAITLGFFQKEVRQMLGLDAAAIPSPTPQAFASAKPGESLIIVADFEPRPKDVTLKDDPAQYIFEELKEQVRKDDLDIRVERLRQVVDDNTARPTGEVYSATLLIWGWYGDVAINPRIERFGLKTIHVSEAESRRMSLANPERIANIVLNDLPNQVKYVVFLTLTLENSSNAKLDESLAYANAAVQSVDPRDETNASEAHFQRGWIHLSMGEPDRAIADYDQAIRLKPDFVDAFFNRGNAYSDKGDSDQAIEDYDQAIKLRSDFAEVFVNRGLAYYNRGEPDQAIADYDHAIKLKPDYAVAYVNRGSAYVGKGELDRAIADFDQAIKIMPDYADALYNRGTALLNKAEYDRAITDYDRTLMLRPHHADAFNNRGYALLNKGEYDRAIADFDQAITIKPNYAQPFANRGIAYYVKGEKEKAIADLKRALELTQQSTLRRQIEELLKKVEAS